MIHSLILAFSMYSRVPMPKSDWSEKAMRHALTFLPFIGIVVGGVVFGFLTLMENSGDIFRSAGAALIPLLITGGIHMDGFLDVTDALASRQTKERRLEIMKDSNSGAFAVIGGCAYLLLYFAAWTSVPYNSYMVVCIGFIYSRTLCGIFAQCLRPAKKDGYLATFKKAASVRSSVIALCMMALGCAAAMFYINPLSASIFIVTGLACFAVCSAIAYHSFGGITGDVAGWFLQVCELSMLTVLVIVYVIL